jgi:hypothetical protein
MCTDSYAAVVSRAEEEPQMSRVVVTNHITLDGVMQAPAHPDEDRRGGFEHGGWTLPYADEVMGRFFGERVGKGGAMLLGRRTYEDLASYWPNQPDDNPFAAVLNNNQKYVASRTLEEPLPWINSTLLGSGRRLFPDGGGIASLRLVDVKPTTTGVMIATYQPAS